jgi:hypothetical protein
MKVLQIVLYACIPANPLYYLENDHDRCTLFRDGQA